MVSQVRNRCNMCEGRCREPRRIGTRVVAGSGRRCCCSNPPLRPFFKADKTETPVPIGYRSSWWARVDYASRAEKGPGSRLPAAASCLGRHAHPAGRSPNSSSLFLPLAAVVAVAQGLFYPPDCSAGRCCSNPPAL